MYAAERIEPLNKENYDTSRIHMLALKNCDTARSVWLKFETIYQSKGPIRMATLLKQLTLQRMRIP